MFKKLVVGALAAGIALTGGIGAASASTEGVDNMNQVKPIKTLIGDYYNYDRGFSYHDVAGRPDIYRTYDVYSSNGIFDNSFYSEGRTWYFKGVASTNWDGSAYGHYEARK
ncbi:LCI fold-containing protein [Bacillus sp. HUB-I-004]|uniref:LCI fold-containing protein n=2 Tax=Bacillus sp. HUB-I-004 TaxID=2568878 RepID=UPI0010A688A8|nr:LCI fold-containing protein [Bacillus sp. HUB-I-004]THG54799.1 hypothetical protein E7Y01_27075 [Bacillus sp. HUB-I-004]